MHSKTLVIISALAIIAALLIGINIGLSITGEPEPTASPTLPEVAGEAGNLSSPSPQAPTVPPQGTTFSHPQCGITFPIPTGFAVDQQATDGARLVSQQTQQEINIACALELPKPPLAPENTESTTISGQLATIYHDASAKDGTPIDVVMLAHPSNGMEVALLGIGVVFDQLLTTISFLP